MDGDEVGLQVLELLLQRLGRSARDEQLALVAADLAADLFLLGREVVALVLEQLGRQGGLRARRCPGVGRFGGGCRSGRRGARLLRRAAGGRLRDAPFVDAVRLARLDARRLPLVDLVLETRLGARRRPFLGSRRRPSPRTSRCLARTCRCCSNRSSEAFPSQPGPGARCAAPAPDGAAGQSVAV